MNHSLNVSLYIYALTYIGTHCIPLDIFYPYGFSHGDKQLSKSNDGSSDEIHISTAFPFFNHSHNSLYVNKNGALSFLSPLKWYIPSSFPYKQHARMVATYWADIDTDTVGDIWYRETNSSILLGIASCEIRSNFPQQSQFIASWIFISTWENVSFHGADVAGHTQRCTFQCILVTDGKYSYAVFKYKLIHLTSETASGGNPSHGRRGTPAQVGFDAGDGIHFYSVPGSQTPGIINITKMSNVGIPGKFIFRVDLATIVISPSPNGYVLLMKGVTGVGTYPPGVTDLFGLWNSTKTINEFQPGANSLTPNFPGHYKPIWSNNWTGLCLDKVRVSIYKNGVEKAFMLFNATGADKMSWFTPSRIIDSSWVDLQSTPKQYFAMSPDPDFLREFYASLNADKTKCDSTGWMFISTANMCFLETDKKPAFYYAPGPNTAHWGYTKAGVGDVFTIQGHITSRSMQIYGNTTHLSRRYFARLWFTLTNFDLDGELVLMQHLPISIEYQVTGKVPMLYLGKPFQPGKEPTLSAYKPFPSDLLPTVLPYFTTGPAYTYTLKKAPPTINPGEIPTLPPYKPFPPVLMPTLVPIITQGPGYTYQPWMMPTQYPGKAQTQYPGKPSRPGKEPTLPNKTPNPLPTMGPYFTTIPYINTCLYKGNVYTQGQKWYDDCDKVCVCQDAKMGLYNCQARCANYSNLSPNCVMVPDSRDPQCCQAPDCNNKNTTNIQVVQGTITDTGTLPPPDTNDCVTEPCQFGYCVDQVNDFVCECVLLFHGKRCQTMKTWAIITITLASVVLCIMSYYICILTCKRKTKHIVKVKPAVLQQQQPKTSSVEKPNAVMFV